MEMLSLSRPDDFHLHLRDENYLSDTVRATADVFSRAIVMPNLQPPIVSSEQVLVYKTQIERYIPKGSGFMPLMTLYLTDNTTADQVIKAKQYIHGIKLYPAGATTNSASGVTDLSTLDSTFAAMIECDIPLLVHGEVTDVDVDIFDREHVFINKILSPLIHRHPRLRIVLEHITTKNAAEFVMSAGENVAATITPQHLLYERNKLLVGGVRPHYYCLPILKRKAHQLALIKAAVSGNSKFFLGTDSAPHSVDKKETSCGCAGCFSAPFAMTYYAEVFEKADALDKLEAFSSHFGADFYRLPRNTDTIELQRVPTVIPNSMKLGTDRVVPLAAGEQFNWRVMKSD